MDKTEELYNVLNNKNLTDAQKVTGINNVLINTNKLFLLFFKA